jgi:selenocysteine lyase/cysteine desulfurase
MVVSDQLAYVRRELQIPDSVIAINAGSWGPLSRAARDAMKQAIEDEGKARGDDPEAMASGYMGLVRYQGPIDEAKAEVAKFINCSPDEVALSDSSTTAMNYFLWGYDFEPGDEIIAGSLENPAAGVPLWIVAERRKLTLRYTDLGNGEKDAVEAIREQITPRTKMILISDVSFATGARVDLKKISEVAHQHGILVLADGIQAVGTYPVDVQELGVDGYALARHKFLCGPDGAGALYVRKSVFDRILPTYAGVFSDAHHGMSGKLVYMDTAQRYEVSTRPIPVIAGGTAALQWIANDVGWDFVYSRTETNYATLYDSLVSIPKLQMLSGPRQSGLMTFAIDGLEPVDIVNKLREQYIFSRTIIVTRPQAVRLSIGMWNRESDLQRIAEVVGDLASRA